MNGIDILEHSGTEYRRLVNGAKWTLASLNWAPRFDAANFGEMERHNRTDETFVLLAGEATLWTVGDRGEDAPATKAATVAGASSPRTWKPIPLAPLKYYNVRAGIWHAITVSKDARVLVAENADTSKDNTDYLDLKTGRIFQKRPTFEEVLPETYLLKVPFGPVWTGIVLVRGRKTGDRGEDAPATGNGRDRGEDAPATEGVPVAGASSPRSHEEANVLIDSSHLPPEKYLIPALADLGLKPSDIDWLLNTHVHGDHIGGHHALVTKYGLKTATLRSAADALRDPVKVAIRVRTRFPKNSPAPQSYLKGVEPDLLLEEGALLANRFAAVATPGHDDDCLTWIDTKTGTAFTGDSLQANGTPTQGVGFYRDLPAYRQTLAKLKGLHLSNIVCGHDYDGIGSVVRGTEAVAEALRFSEERVEVYGKRLSAYVAGDAEDESLLVPLALKLIGEVGCGMPDSLFLALHTVSEHLKEICHD